jgi:hypothetical protein
MAWSKKSAVQDTSSEILTQGSGEWKPVLDVVKDGVNALKLLPVLAIALAILALVSTHKPQTFVGAVAAACTECLGK